MNIYNIQRANAIIKNAIEEGRTLTPEELIKVEQLTRVDEDPCSQS